MTSMNQIKPTGDKILVRLFDPETKTQSGIIIPDNAKEEKSEGVVIALGTGKVNDDGKVITHFTVMKGDVVAFGKYAGDNFDTEEGPCKIMEEREIFAIIRQPQPPKTAPC